MFNIEEYRGIWTVQNEIAYIELLRNQEWLNNLFEGSDKSPTSEQLLKNYRVSFRRRFVNRSFTDWKNEDYHKVEQYLDEIDG